MTVHKTLPLVCFAFFLRGCTAYSIKASEGLELSASVYAEDPVTVTKISGFAEGRHCFEPMLYVLTIGVIPAHCESRYHVGVEEPESEAIDDLETHFTVTEIQGWIALALVMSPNWRYGYVQDPEPEIRQLIKDRNQAGPNAANREKR